MPRSGRVSAGRPASAGAVGTKLRRPRFLRKPADAYLTARDSDPVFRSWADTNLAEHLHAGYAIVSISLKAHGATPGDATSDQMRVMADLAERYGHDELRISHEQNVILPHVHKSDLPAVHAVAEGGWPGDRQYRADLRHHRLPRHGLLRSGDRSLRSRSRRRSRPASRN